MKQKKVFLTIACAVVLVAAVAFAAKAMSGHSRVKTTETCYSGAQMGMSIVDGAAEYDCWVKLENANKAQIKVYLQDSADAVNYEDCALLADVTTEESGKIPFQAKADLPAAKTHYRIAMRITGYNADGTQRELEPLYTKDAYYE